jgi:uncharacterized protein YaiI (UPF0178 family)
MVAIYVDADACPVKDEVYKVAERYGLHVYVVSNSGMSVPRREGIELVAVFELCESPGGVVAVVAHDHVARERFLVRSPDES